MATKIKAADLIGKTIVVGDNQATIVIKSVDGDKLSGEFTKDGKTTPMSFPVSQLQGMTEKGLWRISLTPDPSPKGEGSEVTTEADVQEVQDIVPVVTPRAKSDGGSKTADVPQTSDLKPQTSNQPAAKVEPIGKHGTLVVGGVPKPGEKPKKQEKPKAKTQPSAISHQTSKGTLTYETYTSSKGKPCARIMGFKETDAAYQNAADIHGSHSWITSKDGRVLYVAFGPKYAAKAKEVCDALNAGKSFEDCKAIMDGRTVGEAKTYTVAEVVDLIQRMAKKDPKALAEYEAMLQAA